MVTKTSNQVRCCGCDIKSSESLCLKNPQDQIHPNTEDDVSEFSAAKDFLSFNAASPTTFHCISTIAKELGAKSVQELLERDSWTSILKSNGNGQFFFTRNGSAIIAFSLGPRWKPGNAFRIIATHADSCSLKLLPNPIKSKDGFIQAKIEPYGGGIWRSWFDRDLGLAGRVIIQCQPDGALESRLVNFDRPIGRIPSLAIHLDRSSSQEFTFNLEENFQPIIGMLNESKGNDGTSVLIQLLAKELAVRPESIMDFELNFYDIQPPSLGGLHDEFINARGIDNQMSTFAALQAFKQTQHDHDDDSCWVYAAFDHEEIGSLSSIGAQSNLIESLIERLCPNPEDKATALAKSFLVSADTAHGVHPNYSSRHSAELRPSLNGGVVFKLNHKQRYATNAVTRSLLLRAAQCGNCKPFQDFTVRNDIPCGTTIGPILSSGLGIRTVDIGAPQLSMHSIREMAGTHDVKPYIDVMSAFWKHFRD